MARGKEFTDRLFGLRKRAATGKHDFDTLCAALDIEHRLTPPRSPQTNGKVERFNGRIEDVLQSHHFRSGEELEATLDRYVWLYNQELPQSALSSKTPLQAMKDWHKLKPELFKKQPYYRPGCDTFKVPRAQPLAQQFHTVHPGFDAALAVVAFGAALEPMAGWPLTIVARSSGRSVWMHAKPRCARSRRECRALMALRSCAAG